MMRFHIVVFLVAQQFCHRPLASLRDTAGDQFVQNREHLVLPHGTTLQEDLADRQDLAVVQQSVCRTLQPIPLRRFVIDDILPQSLLREKNSAATPCHAEGFVP